MAGKKLSASGTANGPSDIEEQMKVARAVMERRHQALMALAEQTMEEDRGILSELDKT